MVVLLLLLLQAIPQLPPQLPPLGTKLLLHSRTSAVLVMSHSLLLLLLLLPQAIPQLPPQLPPLGTKLLLQPGHCDPTANMYDSIVAVREGRVVAVWPIAGRGPGL
jgi:hypothetical protein